MRVGGGEKENGGAKREREKGRNGEREGGSEEERKEGERGRMGQRE